MDTPFSMNLGGLDPAQHVAEDLALPARPLAAKDPEHGRVVSLDEPMPPFNVKPSAVMDHRKFYAYEEG